MSKLFRIKGGVTSNIGQLLGKTDPIGAAISKAYSLVLSALVSIEREIDVSNPGDSISKQYDLTLGAATYDAPDIDISSPGSAISKSYTLVLGDGMVDEELITFDRSVSVITPFDPDKVVLHDDDLLLDTDYTTEALNTTADDVPCMPTGGGAVGDGLYVGDANQFHTLEMWLTTPGVGTYTITPKYWNGSTWANLTADTGWDNIANWQGSTWTWYKFIIPGDWAQTTIDGSTLYYIKFEVTAYTTCTTTPLLGWVQIDNT
ncbi:MAG: hypothetical protein ACWGQW_00350 [bacterium]